MGVKNTSIGQLLSYGAIALAGHQAYRYFNSRGKSKQSVLDQDARLDRGLEDTFPASDPMPLSRGSVGSANI